MNTVLNTTLYVDISITSIVPYAHTDVDVKAIKVLKTAFPPRFYNPTQYQPTPSTILGLPPRSHYHRGSHQIV